MADLATLQARLEELKAARGAEKRIRHKGPNEESEVEYKSDSELAAAIAAVEAEIASLSGPPTRIIYPRYKGWF